MSSQTTEGFIKGPLQPMRMELDEKFQLHCHPDVACFNAPSSRSLDFFYLCSYDVDGVREFLESPGFSETYDIDEPFIQQLPADEPILMKSGFRVLKQVLFGEATIPVRSDALGKSVSHAARLQGVM